MCRGRFLSIFYPRAVKQGIEKQLDLQAKLPHEIYTMLALVLSFFHD